MSESTTLPVRYTTSWSTQTRRPHPGDDWLAPSAAERVYAERGDVMVVDASSIAPDDSLRPTWLLSFAANGWVRVSFFNPAGSLWRDSDYQPVDGRLWRQRVTDYAYPDDESFFLQMEAVRRVTTVFSPDGSADVEDVVTADRQARRAHLENLGLAGLWLDRPEFGDWLHLSEPNYGLPTP